MRRNLMLVLVVLVVVCGVGRPAVAAEPVDVADTALGDLAAAGEPAEAPEPLVTGNLAFVSDYRYRGLTQTQNGPAVQGGFTWANPSGLSLELWTSSVSGELYNEGSLEVDLIGLYEGTFGCGAGYEVGLSLFAYPGAGTVGPPRQTYNTWESHVGLSWKMLSVQYCRTIGDWYGVNSDNPLNLSWTPNGSSSGSSYVAATLTKSLPRDVEISFRLGHQTIANYGDASYSDWEFKVQRTFGDLDVAMSYVGTTADEELYSVGDEEAGGNTVFLAVTRNF